jgi:methylmalonyl-CoA mutase N-terminal domain/subunit
VGIFRQGRKTWRVLTAIEKGFSSAKSPRARRYQSEIEKKEGVIVGVNEYVVDEQLKVPLLRMDEAGARHQIARLNRVRRERENSAVHARLDAIRDAAKKPNVNLMPLFIDAVKAYATLGEIMDVLRKQWGEYKEPAIV